MKQKEAIKLLVLCGLAVLLTIGGWLLIKDAFTRLHFEISVPSISILTPFIGSLLLFFAAYAVFGALTVLAPKAIWGLILSLVLAVAGLIVVGFNVYSLVAMVIWALGLSQLAARIREEKRERRKASIHKYMRSGVSLGLIALLLAISFCFYSVSIRSGESQLDPSESLSKITVNRVNQYLITQLPGYDPNMTVNEFLFLVAIKGSQQAKPAGAAVVTDLPATEDVKTEVSDSVPGWLGVDINKLNQQIDTISEDQLRAQLPADFLDQVKKNPRLLTEKFAELQSSMIGQQIDVARNEIARQFNIQAGSQEAIGSVLERAVAQKYQDLFGPFIYLVPPLLALGLFFILQIFNFVFVIITIMFARIIFTSMRWMGFYHIKEESAPIETLVLD
ncbi:MAG: hypothetical protein WC734_02215 [Patescibacteria group bacterium]|jgi:hypothetical protein